MQKIAGVKPVQFFTRKIRNFTETLLIFHNLFLTIGLLPLID